MGENCSATEFSSAAEILLNCRSRTVRLVYSFNLKTKTKAARRRESLQNQIIQVVKNNEFAIVTAYKMQITEVFECHNKTVTRQSSSQRKSRRLSGKLHCLNFVFPPKTKPSAQRSVVVVRFVVDA